MKMATRSCPQCGAAFERRACLRAVYCSVKCRAAAQAIMYRRAPPPCTVGGCDQPAHGRGLCNLHYKRKQIHGDPSIRTIRNAGEGTPHISGYWVITIDGKSKLRHVHIAEQALGRPLPKGAQIHHFDEDRSNDSRDNLVICPSFAYHKLLHKRQAALAACGHADWEKCWRCQKHDAPHTLIPVAKTFAHPTCQRAYMNAGYHRRKNAKRTAADELSISPSH